MKLLVWIYSFENSDFAVFGAIRVSNSVDSDQARHNVKTDLGPNCFQK